MTLASDGAARASRVRLPHPATSAERERRAADLQLRLADAITAFAGSMTFVYLHAVTFAVWMLAVERSPWPTLTLVVSLEAIFLSTFVMIGQNRQSAYQQAKAEHDFNEEELELRANTALTREVHALVQDLLADGRRDGSPRTDDAEPSRVERSGAAVGRTTAERGIIGEAGGTPSEEGTLTRPGALRPGRPWRTVRTPAPRGQEP